MSNRRSREGLTVVITGASSGFGKGIALRLAEEGANVVLAARRTYLIEGMAQEIGPNAIAVTTDVSKEEDMSRLTETALSAFGRLDVWINNAGLGALGSFTEIPLRDQLRMVETNLFGMMIGSRCALRHFKETRHGTLINMSSFISKVPMPFGAVYSATKRGIAGLTAGLHQEMEAEGYDDIHISSVHPWVTDTPWTTHAGNYTGHQIDVWPMDDPEIVIDTVIGLIGEPAESVEVGIKSKAVVAGHNVVPGFTDRMTGLILWELLQAAPPAENTAGSLHEAIPEGVDVSGGNRDRRRKEDAGKKDD
ncbi:SDR family NAD(P)-dependent oxidoreductase [Planococcus lenghuensis]|uniref:Oxidoreductase n=1 Tax=Planococcus lenghuensis TaxID=2213202 RepID=A0A1Q2L2H6_9BACL|nr:SDR family NAD(P)-dependent oxidoreductase [Planococcus lenghuensis]AQQ54574.1 oxidoreductase [Planococcus lenghuensis]